MSYTRAEKMMNIIAATYDVSAYAYDNMAEDCIDLRVSDHHHEKTLSLGFRIDRLAMMAAKGDEVLMEAMKQITRKLENHRELAGLDPKTGRKTVEREPSSFQSIAELYSERERERIKRANEKAAWPVNANIELRKKLPKYGRY